VASLLATSAAGVHARRDGSFSWQTHIEHGPPRLVIGKAVQKMDADLLVLGTRAHTGVAHLFVGSVAAEILRDVPCDVLVVPPRRAAA
jgi:nucleotide-binding universal stress UspA family protein